MLAGPNSFEGIEELLPRRHGIFDGIPCEVLPGVPATKSRKIPVVVVGEIGFVECLYCYRHVRRIFWNERAT